MMILFSKITRKKRTVSFTSMEQDAKMATSALITMQGGTKSVPKTREDVTYAAIKVKQHTAAHTVKVQEEDASYWTLHKELTPTLSKNSHQDQMVNEQYYHQGKKDQGQNRVDEEGHKNQKGLKTMI
jgi:hypothetical protein